MVVVGAAAYFVRPRPLLQFTVHGRQLRLGQEPPGHVRLVGDHDNHVARRP